jgi:hypothetical protein
VRNESQHLVHQGNDGPVRPTSDEVTPPVSLEELRALISGDPRRDLEELLEKCASYALLLDILSRSPEEYDVESHCLKYVDEVWKLMRDAGRHGIKRELPLMPTRFRNFAEGLAALDEAGRWGARAGVELTDAKSSEASDHSSASSAKCGVAVEVAPREWVFAEDGNGYLVAGLGERGHFSSLKGLGVIARLVAAPLTTIPITELHHLDARQQADRRSRQDVVDVQGLSKIKETLEELREDYAKAKQQGNNVEAGTAAEQIEQLKTEMKKMLGPRGRVRNINNKHYDSLRTSIFGQLNRAFAKLRQGKCPKLAAHLEAAIFNERGTFVYRPSPSVRWRTKT